MKKETIQDEIRDEIKEDNFDCLEDKLDKLELLITFELAHYARECSLCESGRLLNECDGSDVGKCGHCNGVGFVPCS
jgi:hypothetical protein